MLSMTDSHMNVFYQGKEGLKGIQGPPGLPGLMVRDYISFIVFFIDIFYVHKFVVGKIL